MRTVTFKSVLNGVLALMGLDLTADAATLALYTEYINERVREGWEQEFWPEWTVVEQRAYRDAYDNTATYGAGTEIFFTDGNYYSANSAPNTPTAGQDPAGFPTKWTLLTTFEKYIALDQAGQTPIGEVRQVTRSNPRVSIRFPGPLAFQMNSDGILVAPLAGSQVWVEFRKRPPVFATTPWDNTTNWGVGVIVFDAGATGECYLALQAGAGHAPGSSPTYWRKIDFPYILASYVKRAAYADALRDAAQNQKAQIEEGNAQALLSRESDVALASQGQYDRATAQVY